MLPDDGNTLILSLADILTGNRVEKRVILEALELICNGASFDCGLVYDVNFLEQFCLMEHYEARTVSLRESLEGKKLPPKEWAALVRKPVSYLAKNAHNTTLERQLLDLYAAESLVLAPVVDENRNTYGMVALLNTKSRRPFLETERKVVSALLSMLVRYVGIRMYQKKLNQAQKALESILDNTGIDIYVNDFNNHDILYVNQSMAAPYGGQKQFMGQKCWKALFPGQTGPCDFCPQDKLIDEQGKPTKVYSWDYQRPFDGSWFRVFSAAFPWVDGRLAHVVSSADITENKRNEAMIENLANYDQLTKLPNRRMLIQECEQRIDNATDAEQGYLLFFDIDGFKSINDSFGHDAGDEFLIQLGEFFSAIPMLKDSIYRNGGDEFVAVLGGETITKANIRNLAGFIHKRFEQPWELKRGKVWCSASVGVACYPEDGRTAEQLLQKADKAMYKVKKSGGNGLCFGYQLEEETQPN